MVNYPPAQLFALEEVLAQHQIHAHVDQVMVELIVNKSHVMVFQRLQLLLYVMAEVLAPMSIHATAAKVTRAPIVKPSLLNTLALVKVILMQQHAQVMVSVQVKILALAMQTILVLFVKTWIALVKNQVNLVSVLHEVFVIQPTIAFAKLATMVINATCLTALVFLQQTPLKFATMEKVLVSHQIHAHANPVTRVLLVVLQLASTSLQQMIPFVLAMVYAHVQIPVLAEIAATMVLNVNNLAVMEN